MVQNHVDRSMVAGGAKTGLHRASADENDYQKEGEAIVYARIHVGFTWILLHV